MTDLREEIFHSILVCTAQKHITLRFFFKVSPVIHAYGEVDFPWYLRAKYYMHNGDLERGSVLFTHHLLEKNAGVPEARDPFFFSAQSAR